MGVDKSSIRFDGWVQEETALGLVDWCMYKLLAGMALGLMGWCSWKGIRAWWKQN